MPGIYEHRLTAQASDIDELGHVNNLAYLAWMQAAALAHSAAQGWPGERYRQLGANWVVRSHHIEYLRPAMLGDEIVVRTWVADFRKVTSLRRYEIVRRSDDRLLAKAATDWAFVTRAAGRPTRVPPEVMQAFEIVERET
jgi:acyl-CoA thioester hydrolase